MPILHTASVSERRMETYEDVAVTAVHERTDWIERTSLIEFLKWWETEHGSGSVEATTAHPHHAARAIEIVRLAIEGSA
jgi:hypothetical protein